VRLFHHAAPGCLLAFVVGCNGASTDAATEDAGTGDGDALARDDSAPDGTADTREAGADAPPKETGAGDAAFVDEAGTWSVVWSDEFDGKDGSEIDRTKWTYDDPQSGKYNKELQYYSTGTANAEQRGGQLIITAKTDGADKLTCWYGPCRYTSARVITKGLFTTKYGRVAARIQIPRGQGLWPAFWLLGDDIDAVSWPACGEIDVMENIGKEPLRDYGTLHATGFDKGGSTDAKTALADGFHVYAVEWDEKAIRFFLDDVAYTTLTPADVPAGGKWAFDHPFYLLLNVAVGGGWPGDPDATSTFPQTMKVDWVRVYRKS
jgi:beta-glucanase (GH16 family)